MVKEFWRSVRIWQSFGKKIKCHTFLPDTVYFRRLALAVLGIIIIRQNSSRRRRNDRNDRRCAGYYLERLVSMTTCYVSCVTSNCAQSLIVRQCYNLMIISLWIHIVMACCRQLSRKLKWWARNWAKIKHVCHLSHETYEHWALWLYCLWSTENRTTDTGTTDVTSTPLEMALFSNNVLKGTQTTCCVILTCCFQRLSNTCSAFIIKCTVNSVFRRLYRQWRCDFSNRSSIRKLIFKLEHSKLFKNMR